MRAFVRLLKYVHRTVSRARLRSLLTVLGTALALALFTFVRMLEGGVDRMAEEANQPVLVVFETSRFCPLTSNLPERYGDEIAGMEGVASVLPTLLFVNACRANLDLITMHGVMPEVLNEIHDIRVIEGDAESWKSKSDGAIVGQNIARRRDLKVGDRLRVASVDVEVHGILESSGAGLDNVVFMQLSQLQLARKKQGIATEFFVRLKDGYNPEEIARKIDERFAGDERQTDTKTMQAFVQGAVSEVTEVIDFARLIGYLAVAVVVLILGNTVYISAQSRSAELGVMETVGVTKTTLAGLLCVESVMLSLAGGALGVGVVAAWLYSWPLTLGVEGWGIDIVPDNAIIALGLVASLLVGIVAAIGPALDIMRRPLATAVKEA